MDGWFTLMQAVIVDTSLYTSKEWREREMKRGIKLWLDRAPDLSTRGMVRVCAEVNGMPTRIGFVGLTKAAVIYELLKHGYEVKCDLNDEIKLEALFTIDIKLRSQNGES